MNKELKIVLIGAGILVALAILFFAIPFPYTATEQRISQEPYTDSYTECVKHSFWTGKCTEYDTRYVTRYREKKVEVKVTRHATLCQMASGQVDWYYTIRQ